MGIANIPKKIIPAILFSVIIAIIAMFASQVGDPTNKNIRNDTNFNIKQSYLISPLEHTLKSILLNNQHQFIDTQATAIPWSFEQQAYWLKFEIVNKKQSPTQLVAHFDNVMLDELTIFQFQASTNNIKSVQLGDVISGLSFSQRTTPHYSFNLEANEHVTLYVRIATTGIAKTPLHIYHLSDFSDLVQKKHILWGVFIGVTVIFALYNLVLFFAAKDFVYLIYNGYILSSLVLMGCVLGYGFYIFPEWLQLVFHQQVVALNCLSVIFAVLFLVYFLKFQVDKKWKFWCAISTTTVFSILLIVSLWLPEYISAKALFIMMPFAFAVCFILLITKMREGAQWEILYIYSWVPLLISAAIQPLMLTGKIEYSFLSHHTFMIAILVEIVLMAMALAARMRYQKEQVIYHATHDILVGLPNQTFLETHISSLLNNKMVFASCLIDIKNYSTLAPYLSTNAILTLERQVINDITPMLVNEPKVHGITHNEEHTIKLAKVADGQLMFIFDTSSKNEITHFMLQVKDKITKEIQLDGLLIELKTNMGICFSSNNEQDMVANEFIQHARLAIEQNKEEEKIHFYHELAVLNIKEHLKLACDLQQAIRENELNLYHQPQINLKTGEIYGSELLLRWQHPEHGFISPELFVGVAEDTGLINELTLWVIEQAFRQVEALQKYSNLAQKISVNISGKDIGLSSLLPYVQDKLEEFNIPANMITFELTESVMVTDFKALDSLMSSLSQLGINVSIDDYGTGYSSLNYISQLKFDELKIDKAFILDLDHSSRNLAIVKATIEMAKNLKLKVVAEGVESKAIELKLSESGCDIVQGYYYSKPLPFDDYLIWLDNYKNPIT